MSNLKSVSFKILNDKNEEVRKISVEVEPGKGWKKRAEEQALKQIAETEKIELIPDSADDQNNTPSATPPAPETPKTPTTPSVPVFVFKFEFIKDDKIVRTENITVRAETREYAWRKSIELAQQKSKEGETYRFAGDVVPGNK